MTVLHAQWFCLWLAPQLPHALLVWLAYYLWIAPKMLLAVLAFLMFRRGLHRQFPMFFLYALFQLVQSAILWAAHLHAGHPNFDETYTRLFSGGTVVSSALRFGVIYEVFRQVFRNYPALTETGKMLFRGVTVVLLVVGVGFAALIPGKSVNLLMLATTTLDRTVSLLQLGLLLSLFIFSRYFALSLRGHAFGIALGLGTYASVQLATSAVLLYVGSTTNPLPNFITMATYHCCVLIWMFYLLLPERTAYFTRRELPKQDLDVWNQELQRLLQR